jgi:hypothetical protein
VVQPREALPSQPSASILHPSIDCGTTDSIVGGPQRATIGVATDRLRPKAPSTQALTLDRPHRGVHKPQQQAKTGGKPGVDAGADRFPVTIFLSPY